MHHPYFFSCTCCVGVDKSAFGNFETILVKVNGCSFIHKTHLECFGIYMVNGVSYCPSVTVGHNVSYNKDIFTIPVTIDSGETIIVILISEKHFSGRVIVFFCVTSYAMDFVYIWKSLYLLYHIVVDEDTRASLLPS